MAKEVSPGVLALRKVVDDVHADARKAHAEGRLVGWSSSKFPCELAAAFDLDVMYPENQAAGIAANRDGELMCKAAEDLGFDNDICGYARISLAYAAGKRASRKVDLETGEYVINPASGKPLKDADGKVVIDPETGKPKKDPKTMQPYTVLDDIYEIEALPEGREKELRKAAIKPYRQMRIPQPDFVLCCNNICNCMTKWYENIARMRNIPLIMIDIPYNNTVEVHDTNVAYVRAQFDEAIKQLEELTGKKFDEKKFEQACANANRTASAWLRVCDYLQYKPAPYSGFDLFNHMADIVTARAKVEAGEAFELLGEFLKSPMDPQYGEAAFTEFFNRYLKAGAWDKVLDLGKLVSTWDMKPQLRKQLDYALALSAQNLNLTGPALAMWQQLAARPDIPLYQRAYATYFLARDAENRKDIKSSYELNRKVIDLFTQLQDERSDKADPQRIKEAVAALMDICEVGNRIPEALQWVNRYNDFVPENSSEYPGLRFREARLYRKLGNSSRAQALLEDLARRFPDSPFAKAAAAELRTFEVSRDLQNYMPGGTPAPQQQPSQAQQPAQQ